MDILSSSLGFRNKLDFCSRTYWGHGLVKVSRIRNAGLLAAVLLWAVTPAVACLLPGFAPTPVEQECCHHMASHCGQAVMPASHACCQDPSRPDVLVQGQATLLLKHAVVVATVPVPIVLADVAAKPALSSSLFPSPPGESPPGSSTVLRI